MAKCHPLVSRKLGKISEDCTDIRFRSMKGFLMANNSGPSPIARLGNPMTIVLIGVGLLAIGIGANGIRSNDTIVEQMPYILTGGFVGVAFVIFGCAYLVVQNARQDRVALEAKLTELIEVLADSATGGSRTSSPGDVSGLVAAGTASYHVPSCRLVDGREEVAYLTPAEARDRDLKACRVCQPDNANTNVTVR